MNRKKLEDLKDQLEGLRRQVANLKRADVVGFAEALGRRPAKRGKEEHTSAVCCEEPDRSVSRNIENSRSTPLQISLMLSRWTCLCLRN